ncbi:hypothetical protein Tco_0270050 [Tanacetum coccineum]
MIGNKEGPGSFGASNRLEGLETSFSCYKYKHLLTHRRNLAYLGVGSNIKTIKGNEGGVRVAGGCGGCDCGDCLGCLVNGGLWRGWYDSVKVVQRGEAGGAMVGGMMMMMMVVGCRGTAASREGGRWELHYLLDKVVSVGTAPGPNSSDHNVNTIANGDGMPKMRTFRETIFP